MRFEEFCPLAEQLALPRDEPLPVGDIGLAEGSDLLEDRLLGLESKVATQLDAGVVRLDGRLHVVDAERSLGAAGAVSLAADADEVRVDPP